VTKVRKNRVRVSLMVGVAVLGSMALGMFAAQATEGQCDGGEVCFWVDAPFSGAPEVDNNNTGTGWINAGDTGFPGSFDNQMSSWANHKAVDGRWASGTNGSGVVLRCMDQHSSDGSLGVDVNDTMSSYRIYTTDDVCGT
jgi:hypothetical protein